MVRVTRVYDGDEGNASATGNGGYEDTPADERSRLVATENVGGCHHVFQLLQVVRLLQMTARELSEFDLDTVTGRACMWLLKHSNSGRDPAHNMFFRMRLPQIAQDMRNLRDLQRPEVGSDDEESASTRGIVAEDRSQGFNLHPERMYLV